MTRLAVLALAALALYVLANWWAFRVTGHPEPDPLAEAWFA